ncbi:hypothetical protein DERF_009800 [Dermatophagoides farinae]|uniref:RNase H type-1 domain-containing protein n=1 Tax=Dermatophagoides farinae TaxID=6954 RepID=A0A922HXC6_DERFA|nr:hypothetical protein DERF_009800 [Dermatophagoides farinae]
MDNANTTARNNRSTSKPYKCLQINCRKAYAPTKETLNYILNENIDIAFVSEPWLMSQNHPANISPLTCLYHDTPNNRTTAAIYVNNNNINPILIQQLSSSKLCVVDVSLNGQLTRLVSVYRSPADLDIEKLIDELEQTFPSTSNHDIIIAGDFNAHHTEWSCPTNDRFGEYMYDFSIANNLNIHNEGTSPTFVNIYNNTSSIIDLTFSSTGTNIEQWKVKPDAIIGSDHSAIEFSINPSPTQSTDNNRRKSTYRYRTEDVNWETIAPAFRTEMDRKNISKHSIAAAKTPEEIDNLVTSITTIIIEVCDQSIKRRGRFIIKKCPWWDDELEQMKKSTIRSKHQYQNAKSNGQPNNILQQKLEVYIENKRNYAKKIRQKSTDNFTKYLQSCQGMTDIKKINKLIADTTTTKFPTTLMVNGRPTTDHNSNVNALMDRFFPAHPPQNLSNPNYLSLFGDDEVPFSNDEILQASKSMNHKKAPGADGLTADIIYHFITANIVTVKELFNKCLSMGHFPTQMENCIRPNNIGCIQGSVSGPILWNILMDTIFDIALPDGCKLVAFADDLLLLTSGKEMNQLAERTQTAIDLIIEWGNVKRLTFSAAKTYIMGFSQIARAIDVKINGESLTMKDNVKYLGIVIDQKLKFDIHAEYVMKKLANFYHMFSRLIRPNWGLNPEIAKMVYKTVAEPMALYGASIWHKIMETKKYAQRLLKIQRRILVNACRGNRTISYTSVFLVNNVIPVDIKIMERAAIEKAKSLTGIEPHLCFGNLEMPVPTIKLPHPGERVRTGYTQMLNHNQIDEKILGDGIYIFTDGSKLDNRTGAASVFTANGQVIEQHQWRLADGCSVFQAELIAIKESISRSMQMNYSSISIFSDSKSSLESIANRMNCHPIVFDINKQIDILRGKNITTTLHWIKAHNNYKWNEMADELAKGATTLNQTSAIYKNIPISSFKYLCRQESNQKWMMRTATSCTGRWTNRLLPNTDIIKEFDQKIKSTKQITQFLTGHGPTKHYLHRFKIANDDKCPCDGHSSQTMEHVIQYCDGWARERHLLMIKHNI